MVKTESTSSGSMMNPIMRMVQPKLTPSLLRSSFTTIGHITPPAEDPPTVTPIAKPLLFWKYRETVAIAGQKRKDMLLPSRRAWARKN